MDGVIEDDMDHEFNTFMNDVSCSVVISFPYKDRCDFVKTAPECTNLTNLANYMTALACDFNCRNKFEELVFVTFFVLICAELLLLLGYVIDMYYSPALKVVSQMMHMNEHLAGVTLLAFGNSSPDFFSNMAGYEDEAPIFANSLSMAIFVALFTGGLVCYLSPFKMNSHGTVRDVLFFILGVSLLEFVLATDSKITLTECYVLIGVYLFYLVVNILDLIVMRLEMKLITRKIHKLRNIAPTPENRMELDELERKYEEMADDANIEILERESGIFYSSRHTVPSDKKPRRFTYTTDTNTRVRQSVNLAATRDVLHNDGNSRNHDLVKEFLLAINPIDCEEWREDSMFMRAFLIAKAPVVFLCAIYVPLVDYELDKHGWSKLLNCLHLIINPALTYMTFDAIYGKRTKAGPYWYMNLRFILGAYTLPVTVPLFLIVFLTSRTDKPPIYHWLYTILNLTGSVFLVFIAATEIDLILSVIGNILDIPEDFMGVTINAIAGALGDLIANSAMALQGYEKMAYAAAIGGPFFTIVLATGFLFMLRNYADLGVTKEGSVGQYGENAYYFLNFGLFATLLWTTTLNFSARRSVGVFSILIYMIYILYSVLQEQSLIHSYTPDAGTTPR